MLPLESTPSFRAIWALQISLLHSVSHGDPRRAARCWESLVSLPDRVKSQPEIVNLEAKCNTQWATSHMHMFSMCTQTQYVHPRQIIQKSSSLVRLYCLYFLAQLGGTGSGFLTEYFDRVIAQTYPCCLFARKPPPTPGLFPRSQRPSLNFAGSLCSI